MKVIIRLMAICLLITFFSCEKGDWYQRKCADCTADEPTDASVEVLLSPFSNTGKTTLIRIFEGNVEDSILLFEYETTSTKWIHILLINKTYTFSARYDHDGTTYEAFTSVRPFVSYEKFLCVSPCYTVRDNLADLRLKYH
jgi:hypothetical protein